MRYIRQTLLYSLTLTGATIKVNMRSNRWWKEKCWMWLEWILNKGIGMYSDLTRSSCSITYVCLCSSLITLCLLKRIQHKFKAWQIYFITQRPTAFFCDKLLTTHNISRTCSFAYCSIHAVKRKQWKQNSIPEVTDNWNCGRR